MAQQQIAPEQWSTFLASFARSRERWLVLLRGTHDAPEDLVPLCGLRIEGEPDEPQVVVSVGPADEPREIAISNVQGVGVETVGGVASGLVLAGRAGTLTLRLRTAIDPALVDDLPRTLGRRGLERDLLSQSSTRSQAMNTFAEIALGPPLTAAEEQEKSAAMPGLELAGRILLGLIFVISGIMMFADYGASVAQADAAGLPLPSFLVGVGGVVEILGGLSLLLGFATRLGALTLSVFLVLTSLYFHDFWLMTGEARLMQMVHFLKNLAIMGGMFLLMVYGAGRLSLDRVLRERMSEN